MKANVGRITRGMNGNHRKEKGFIGSIHGIAVVDGKAMSACELRLYATSSRVYACFWVHAGDVFGNGSGFAGGYGYCKKSAAAAAAIRAAGIELSEDVSGRGMGTVKEAIKAITAAVYPNASDVITLESEG